MRNSFKRFSVFLATLMLAAVMMAVSAPAVAESGFSGMQVQGMSAKIAGALGMKKMKGVLVRDVALGGPADKAGFRRGDLIVEFAGKDIDNFKDMVKAAGSTRPGLEVKVSIHRQGKPMTLSLKLGKWTEPWRIKKSVAANLTGTGATLATLSPKLRKGFQLRWGSIGVVVTLVDEARKDIGLQRGDVIVQVNLLDVWKPRQVVAHYKAAKKAGRKELLLLIERVNGFHYMALPVR